MVKGLYLLFENLKFCSLKIYSHTVTDVDLFYLL